MSMRGLLRRMTSVENVETECPEDNPVALLLSEIIDSFYKFDSKKELFKHIKTLVKSRQRDICNSTNNIWFKKYEIEEREKLGFKAKLGRVEEVNRILADRVVQLQKVIESKGFDQTFNDIGRETKKGRFVEVGGVNDSRVSCTTLTAHQEAESVINSQSQNGAILPSSSEDMKNDLINHNCPLCSKSLHDVFDLLEEKESKIVSINTYVKELHKKGRELISQSNSYSQEVANLNQISDSLKRTILVLEKQLQDTNENYGNKIKEHIQTIENMRNENDELRVRIGDLESQISSIKLDNLIRNSGVQNHKSKSLFSLETPLKKESKANLKYLPTLNIDDSEHSGSHVHDPPQKCSKMIQEGYCRSGDSTNKNTQSHIRSKVKKDQRIDPNLELVLSTQRKKSTHAELEKEDIWKDDQVYNSKAYKHDHDQPVITRNNLNSEPGQNQAEKETEGRISQNQKNRKDQTTKLSSKKELKSRNERLANKMIRQKNDYGCVLI